MKGRQIIILVVVMIVAAGAFYAYSEYNRENKDMADAKPDVTVDAASLIKEFEQDSAGAGKKYMDKIIQVRGQVKSVDTAGVITLGVPGEMSSVQCTMDKRHAVDYRSIKEGDQLSIVGKCSGYQSDELLGTDVNLNFCVIK